MSRHPKSTRRIQRVLFGTVEELAKALQRERKSPTPMHMQIVNDYMLECLRQANESHAEYWYRIMHVSNMYRLDPGNVLKQNRLNDVIASLYRKLEEVRDAAATPEEATPMFSEFE